MQLLTRCLQSVRQAQPRLHCLCPLLPLAAAWQSERVGAVLFPTGDTLPDLRRIDDALSGQRLTLVLNPQWQTQGQVISGKGGAARTLRCQLGPVLLAGCATRAACV